MSLLITIILELMLLFATSFDPPSLFFLTFCFVVPSTVHKDTAHNHHPTDHHHHHTAPLSSHHNHP